MRQGSTKQGPNSVKNVVMGLFYHDTQQPQISMAFKCYTLQFIVVIAKQVLETL